MDRAHCLHRARALARAKPGPSLLSQKHKMAAAESELPVVILGAGISGNVFFAKGEEGLQTSS